MQMSFRMAGLVPAIHVVLAAAVIDVDARDKPGHDELEALFQWSHLSEL